MVTHSEVMRLSVNRTSRKVGIETLSQAHSWERSGNVERKWHERYPQKFRIRAVERMNSCDNVLRLARELGLNRSLLYNWRYRLDQLMVRLKATS